MLVRRPVSCWTVDHNEEISVAPIGHYYNRLKMDGTSESTIAPVRSNIQIAVTAQKFVKVAVRVRGEPGFPKNLAIAHLLQPDDPRTIKEKADGAGRVNKVTADFIAAVHKHWNGKFKLEVVDPVCGKLILPIIFELSVVTEDEHYILQIHEKYDREEVDGELVILSLTTDEFTFIHEFAHCIGVPDEYSYSSKEREKVRYMKPDLTFASDIVVLMETEVEPKANENFMNTNNSLVMLERHAWPIAVEVHRILSDATGRTLRCKVLLA